MICEDVPQTHIRAFGKAATGFALVRDVEVEIERTACHLGGSRAWFLCPTCGRRCAILYPMKCRVCLKLHYTSEHKGQFDRHMRSAIKHRMRYGQTEGGIAVPFPGKPKRMRWHTYLRARRKARELEQRAAAAFAKMTWIKSGW